MISDRLTSVTIAVTNPFRPRLQVEFNLVHSVMRSTGEYLKPPFNLNTMQSSHVILSSPPHTSLAVLALFKSIFDASKLTRVLWGINSYFRAPRVCFFFKKSIYLISNVFHLFLGGVPSISRQSVRRSHLCMSKPSI